MDVKEVKGIFMYQGVHTTQQVDNIKEYFEKFLIEENFDLIIEIGTSFAGLTYIIDDIRKENGLKFKLKTIDNAEHSYVKDYLSERGVDYLIMDEFNIENFDSFMVNSINSFEKVLILCDGGNKIYEFNKISNFLKSGDFIMAHDYSHDLITFEEKIKNKIWNWMEIEFKDIVNSVSRNNLIPYTKLDFQNVVWCCFSKETNIVNEKKDKIVIEPKLENKSVYENLKFLKQLLDSNLITTDEFLKLKLDILK